MANGVVTTLGDYEQKVGQQQGQFQQQRLHDANMLQMAQAQQVARGQSTTSQNAMGGTSPITQSVLKAKALAASSLDQDTLSDDQKDMVDKLSKDPNTGYNEFVNAIGQVRQGQGVQQRQENTDARATALGQRRAQIDSQKKRTQQIQNVVQQERLHQQQMEAASKALQGAGYNLDAGTPGEDPQATQLRQQYQASKQAVAQFQKQHDDLLMSSTQETEPGVDDKGTAGQADASGAQPDAMTAAGYGKGSISITSNKPTQQAQPAGRGKATKDLAHQYLNKFGGDPAKARAALKADGWSL